MDPMPGAIEAVQALAALGKYELYILSTAPWGNPSAWTDKAKWVQKHFDSDRPDGVFYKRLILSHHKNMCVQPNAWLIDDRKAHVFPIPTKNGIITRNKKALTELS